MNHHELPMLPVQVDGDVPRVLHHSVRHVDIVHCSVISKLALLVGKVDLGSREDLDVSANMLSQFSFQTKKVFLLIFFFSDLV